MRKIILITLIFISQEISSQNKFLDFIITHDNDTIYGRYRGNKLIDSNKKSRKINRKKIKTIRSNDKIYHLTLLKNKEFFSYENDSLIGVSKNLKPLFKKENYYYVRKLNKNERRDFIVINNNDTIFGKIKQTTFEGKKLVTDLGEKYSVSNSILYREKGAVFFIRNDLKTKGSLTSPKKAELLYNGKKAKLFKQIIQTQNYYNVHYYIEKDGKMNLIIPERFTKMIMRIMPGNKKLLSKLKKREYTYHDIYLVVKFFNET